jgi:dihydroorotase-like cyclic amidohydrolase
MYHLHDKGRLAAGCDADLAIVDPGGPARALTSTLADAYETYPGRTTTLAVRRVLVRGRVVVADGDLADADVFGGRALA